MFSSSDELFMQKALYLAQLGRGFVSPNPMVGACIVKNGKLIASGYHEEFGGAHAEVIALQKAGKLAKGSILYVTLEPCSTWGKTPPCTRAIIESQIKRVVIAAKDPNPAHAGRGIKLLRQAGIRTEVGLLSNEANRLNRGFAKWIQTQLPYVTVKLAQSLDGKIATKSGDSRWVTGPDARNYVHVMRAESDAVLVGKNTALRDNPLLSVRHVKSEWQPWRMVIDTRGEMSPKARLFSFNPKRGGKAVVICSEKHIRRVCARFRKVDFCLLPCAERNGKMDLEILFKKLGAFGITSVLVEGGGVLAAALLENKLVDEICLFVAPKIIGGNDSVPSFSGRGVRQMQDAISLKHVSVEKIGSDFLFRGFTH